MRLFHDHSTSDSNSDTNFLNTWLVVTSAREYVVSEKGSAIRFAKILQNILSR